MNLGLRSWCSSGTLPASSVIDNPLLRCRGTKPEEIGSLFRIILITQITGQGMGDGLSVCSRRPVGFIYIISHSYITENFMTSKRDFP